MRPASPLIATPIALIAAPAKVAAWAVRKVSGPNGRTSSCQAQALAASDSRLIAPAAASSAQFASVRVVQVTSQGNRAA
jgi:hypothetical protein